MNIGSPSTCMRVFLFMGVRIFSLPTWNKKQQHSLSVIHFIYPFYFCTYVWMFRCDLDFQFHFNVNFSHFFLLSSINQSILVSMLGRVHVESNVIRMVDCTRMSNKFTINFQCKAPVKIIIANAMTLLQLFLSVFIQKSANDANDTNVNLSINWLEIIIQYIDLTNAILLKEPIYCCLIVNYYSICWYYISSTRKMYLNTEIW